MTSIILAKKVGRGSFNWMLFLLLLGLGSFGLIAVVPYGLTMAGQPLGRSELELVAIQFVLQVAALAVQIGLGLFVGSRIGLGVPLVAGWLGGESVRPRTKALLLSTSLGVAAGVVALALDLGVFVPGVTAEYQSLGVVLPETSNPPAWQALLASFYGGINEEIMMRLCLLTLLAWLGSRFSRTSDGRPTSIVLWVSTVLAGLALGLGHLPGAAALGIPLTPLSVSRTIVLNSSGILFGWLYWKRGLEAAMVSHFSMDIILHVVGAMVLVV